MLLPRRGDQSYNNRQKAQLACWNGQENASNHLFTSWINKQQIWGPHAWVPNTASHKCPASRSCFLLDGGALVPPVMGANFLQHIGAGISLQLKKRISPEQESILKTPHWRRFILKDECTLGQGKCLRRKKCQRGAVTE